MSGAEPKGLIQRLLNSEQCVGDMASRCSNSGLKL